MVSRRWGWLPGGGDGYQAVGMATRRWGLVFVAVSWAPWAHGARAHGAGPHGAGPHGAGPHAPRAPRGWALWEIQAFRGCGLAPSARTHFQVLYLGKPIFPLRITDPISQFPTGNLPDTAISLPQRFGSRY